MFKEKVLLSLLLVGVLLIVMSSIVSAEDLKVIAVGMSSEQSDSLITEFNKVYPDIEVKIDVIPWSGYYAKTLSTIRAGLYDVYYIPQLYPITYNAAYLEPLDSWAEKEGPEFLEQFIPSILEIGRRPDRDGKLHQYAIPFDADLRLIAYDKKIFDKYDIEYLPEDGNYTIKDLRNKALKIYNAAQEAGELAYGMGLRARPMDYFFPAFMSSLGQEAFEYEFGSKKAYFDTPEAKEALQALVDIEKAGAAGPETLGGDYGVPQFFTENNPYAISMVGYGDVVKTLPPVSDRFKIVPLPNNPKTGMGGPAFFHGWAIHKTSKNKEAGWKWIKFGASDAAQEWVFNAGISGMPVVKRFTDWTVTHPYLSPDKAIKISDIPEMQILKTQFDKSNPVLVDNWVKVRSIIREELGNALSLEKTVDQVLEDMQSDIETAMKDRLWSW